MPSPFSQFFRKNGGDNSAEPEDLECGRGSSILQTPTARPTASGYHSSLSRVYLPKTQSASTVPQTPISIRECFSHIQYNGQNESVVHVPLTPSGPSRVIGYLPRIMYNGSSPLVGPTTMPLMPPPPPENASNGDSMGNSGPHCCSTSIYSTPFIRSPSPSPQFESDKYGQALRRLETHGSLKTVPSSQQKGDAVDRPSISLTEFCQASPVEDHSAGLRDSPPRQPRSQNSADPYETANQESGVSVSSPSIQNFPNSVYQEVVFNREDFSNLPEVPQFEGGQPHRDASPAFEEIDEYLWSPAPSDDGQEAPSAPSMPVPHHALSKFSRASSASDSHGGFSRSKAHDDEYIYSQPGSSGNPCATNSLLPHIDVLIPAGNINLNTHTDFLSSSQHAVFMGSRESSSILLRYSGLIMDGASSRPMFETELKEEVLHSLGDPGKSRLSIPSLRDSSSQVDRNANSEQICGDHEENARPGAFLLGQVQNTSADAGPGSSQTSSSLSTDRYGRSLSGLKAWSGSLSSRARCPTPPLLFGKNAIGEPEGSNSMQKPALGGSIGRFDQTSRATRLKETGCLPSALCTFGEQDWETVSAETEAHTLVFDSAAIDTKTGSSLADNSDSGNLSLSKETKETPSPFRDIRPCPVLQHPAHPRHNHSFMLLKDSQTGDLVQVPQYEYASGGYLPNNNASSQLYEHPSPLRVEHNHPFTSLPPIISFTNPPATSAEDNYVGVQRDSPNSESSSGLSKSLQEGKKMQTQNLLYKTNQDILHVPDSGVSYNGQEQSRQSSAWLSTVSEVTSSEPSLPGSGGPFMKIITWDGKGHVSGTPEQRGNREVGSSLADASSPGADFSSSPALVASSPIQLSDTPPSLRQSFHEQAVQKDLEFGNQNLLAIFHKSLARSFNRKDSAISTSNTDSHSRSYSTCGTLPQHRRPSPRRRRSSSESHSKLVDSPSAQKASALNMPSSGGHAQQTNSFGLLLRNPFLHSDESSSRYDSIQQNVTEQRGQQPRANDTSINDPTTPSSAESRPFVWNRVVHTDTAPPILYHPVYGRNRPWGRISLSPLRPRPHPNPLGRTLFQRPLARAESPHLYRIPHAPTPEVLERQILLSRVYLIPTTVIPPIALVYGHGYMDGIMRLHTAGEINGFRNTEKVIALYWGYGMSAICIFAIVIAMIIISASA